MNSTIRIIDANQLEEISDKAKMAERLRAHLNIHESLDSSVQRLFIATEPGTYMRPHQHPQSHKWEFLTIIAGELDLLLFDEDGSLLQREKLCDSGVRSVQIAAGVCHAYVCCAPGTLALEIKEGAYIPTATEDFASWSPAEGSAEAANFVRWMEGAQVGDSSAEFLRIAPQK